MSNTNLLFRVIANHHEYKIYTDGRISGFGEDAQVFNYFPRSVQAPSDRPQVEPEAVLVEGTPYRRVER